MFYYPNIIYKVARQEEYLSLNVVDNVDDDNDDEDDNDDNQPPNTRMLVGKYKDDIFG